MSVLLTYEGGSVYWDLTTQETHTGTVVVTDHPVEKGVDVSDHVRPQLDHLELEGFISNAPLEASDATGGSINGVELDVPRYEPPLSPTPGSVFGAVEGGLANALFGGPGPTVAQVLTFDTPFDRVRDLLEVLRDLQNKATLITAITSVKTYDAMIIENVSIVKNAETGTGATLSLALRQLRVVESQVVPAPVPTEARGAPVVKKGPQGPKDAKVPDKKKSAMKVIQNAIKGAGL